MIILIRPHKRMVLLLVVACLILCGSGFYLWNQVTKTPAVPVDNDLQEMLTTKVQQIFKIRNKALLKRNADGLENLYNTEVKTGRWAYEHELKRMKYLHKWSVKQGVDFKAIDSQITVKRITEKEDGFSVTLSVSTEYQYAYEDSAETNNSFRTGTYHVLSLMSQQEGLAITKEWYRDPFADSLNLDKIKNQQVKQSILSHKPKNLAGLSHKRVEAVKYVDQYSGAASPPKYGSKYNSNYKNYNYQGGDCANFASQMLYEGGGFRKNRTWNYKQRTGSKAWVNAHAFNRYMLNSGRASLVARGTYDEVLKSSYKLLPGDYIAYEKNGGVAHISIVTGIDSKGYILVNSHNADRHRVPWDLGWSNKGIKFWLARVNY